MNDERAAELEALCDRCDRLGGGSVLADAIDVRALLAARQGEQRLREALQCIALGLQAQVNNHTLGTPCVVDGYKVRDYLAIAHRALTGEAT